MSESNTSGTWLENRVQEAFENEGFITTPYVNDSGTMDLVNPKKIIQRVPFKNLYGSKSYTEFVLIDERYGRQMRIECKTQETSGSVHEKIPYFYLNAIRCYPENEICFIYSGEWLTESPAGNSAIKWLKRATTLGLFCDTQKKKFHIVSLNNLRRFARDVAQGGP